MESESALTSQPWTVTIEIPGEPPHILQVAMSAAGEDSWVGTFDEADDSQSHPNPVKGTLQVSRRSPESPEERTQGGVTLRH